MGVASGELKKHGSFKLAGMLALKLKKKPATPARKREPGDHGKSA